MGSVVGEILPLAMVIALSPPPVIAVVLMLLSPNAKANSLGYLAGWVAGILTAVIVMTWLATLLPKRDPDSSTTAAGIFMLVLGAALIVLAVRQWMSRPRGSEDAALPSWMAAVDSMVPRRALMFGFLLSALNPKNLMIAASAGLLIGASDLSGSLRVVAVVIFTLLAAGAVLGPVVAFFLAPARVMPVLQELREWLVVHNTALMSAITLVIGVAIVGNGLDSL
jgi:hypothetical protein